MIESIVLDNGTRYVRENELKLWVLMGDEELGLYNRKSRTADPKWQEAHPVSGNCTPSVFRFDKQPIEPKNDYRVDISPLDGSIRALNDDSKKVDYLYADNTALYNSTGYPKQAYITMSGNMLLEDGIEGNYLRFKTITPNSETLGLSHVKTPWFVHRFDIVCFTKDGATYHTHTINNNIKDVDYFLVTKEGVGYIPLDRVKRVFN